MLLGGTVSFEVVREYAVDFVRERAEELKKEEQFSYFKLHSSASPHTMHRGQVRTPENSPGSSSHPAQVRLFLIWVAGGVRI